MLPITPRLPESGSERELNTEEEEEAKFKSGAQNIPASSSCAVQQPCATRVVLSSSCGCSTVPCCPLPAVRTGVVQRPKDKLLTMDPKEITYEMVQKKLQEIAMARGKTTRIDRQEQV